MEHKSPKGTASTQCCSSRVWGLPPTSKLGQLSFWTLTRFLHLWPQMHCLPNSTPVCLTFAKKNYILFSIFHQEVFSMNDTEQEARFIPCPVCKKRTDVKVYADTVLLNFILCCPHCKTESIINVIQFKMTTK